VLPDGKRRTLYGKTRQDAADKLRAAQAATRSGQPIPSRKVTLAAFIRHWQNDVLTQRVRISTFDRYDRDLRLHILPKLGSIKLAELTPQKIQMFLNGLTTEGMGPRGVAHCRAVLRSALQQALREGLLGLNAAKLVTIPRQTKKKVTALTPEDARAILDAFAGHDLEALVTFALASGARQGECLGLLWSDIDFEAGTVTIARQLQRLRGEYVLVDLKTERSRRTLALPAVATEALRAHRARQAERRLLLGHSWQVTGCVFTGVTGGYLNGSTVTHAFRARLKAKGLPVRSFYSLRHGAASLLLARGANLRTIMEQLGHSQIALTADTYTHIAPVVLRDAADRLNDALSAR
jgi:integrase